MIRWTRPNKPAITIMLVILGIAISQVPARASATVNVDGGGYEMRVHLDSTLSINSARVGDRFTATVADPGPFSLARISGHIQSISPSALFNGATEINLSFDRICCNDGAAYSITRRVRKARGITLITADHGNAEQMINPITGGPHTAHTTNPVPFHLINEDSVGMKLRTAAHSEDVAPTLLGLLGAEKPAEMTGTDLRNV